MRNHRHATHSSFTRDRLAALGVAVLAVVAASAAFIVHTRGEIHRTRNDKASSLHHVAQLDAAQRDAVDARSKAFAELEHEQDLLRNDTAAHDRLVATDRAESRLLSGALNTLAQHHAALAAGAAHAALLDECLVGASQVLNEASVGDIKHLATTLPPVQRVCSQAAA